MAIWQIDIQKSFGTEFWTNVYHGEVADQDEAVAFANALVDLEKHIHCVGVIFVNYRVRPYPGPAEGTTYALTGEGLVTAGAWVPLFNVLRVDFPAPTGRPSRKYYRLPLVEGDIENDALSTAKVGALQTVFDNFFLGSPSAPACDVDGQHLNRGVVFRQIGMRQLRRGSRRRTTPII